MAKTMGGAPPRTGLALLLLAAAAVLCAAAAVDKQNKSSWGGILWATAKDKDGDALHPNPTASSVEPVLDGADPDANTVGGVSDDDVDGEFAGGFSSLDGMLQWAIGHSDPAKLKEKASDVQHMSADELKTRQLEIKELMEKLKMPSDAELMQIAIGDLNNSSISLEDRQRALDELLILVEPIDNANDLDKLGGLVAVIRELNNSEAKIRTTSAWILGKASQNNPLVQNQVLSLGALNTLMKMVQSGCTEEAVKALYAISALVRNNGNGQAAFYAESGDVMLQDIMSNSSTDARLRKKAVFMVADLADCQLENPDHVKLPLFRSHIFLKSVVNLTLSSDIDLQEKALLAIRSLLQLSSTEATVFKDFCSLDEALEKMREQLENLMTVDKEGELAGDLEGLRREVYTIFHKKLETAYDLKMEGDIVHFLCEAGDLHGTIVFAAAEDIAADAHG
ncbi:hypothetical protein Taro_035003 [Colocasia esculenta]|uniref:Nucleotide exchange factor Fes1 domain-containing protein n=1 Tax=Colocasia esculenta TaxID=4460 RepID=A0A843VZB0_COLES|nr:hypothetical protein [Colocasia esculenta]